MMVSELVVLLVTRKLSVVISATALPSLLSEILLAETCDDGAAHLRTCPLEYSLQPK